MVEPPGDVDQFGLPTGSRRHQLFARVLLDLEGRLDADGWGSPAQVFALTTDVAPEPADAGPDNVTGVGIQQVGRLLDSPIEDLWGQQAPDSVAALVVSVEGTAVPLRGQDTLERAVRLLFLVSRAGDSAQVCHIRGETASFHLDGDGPTTALPQVMARMLGVPGAPARFRPVHLLAAWIISHVIALLSSAYAAVSAAGDQWDVATLVQACAADAAVVTDAEWESFARAATAAVTIRVLCDYGDECGMPASGPALQVRESLPPPQTFPADITAADVSAVALQLRPAAHHLNQLSWEQMSESAFAGLLPALLRSPESTRWAGEELSGWWVFHHAAQTPAQMLDQLRVLSPVAEATCAHVLALFGFTPPSDTWSAPDGA